jgi:hypothetical protein
MRKLPYFIELKVSGEICSFVQEEQPPGFSDWQLRQTANKAKK